jgi:hypothetical protein
VIITRLTAGLGNQMFQYAAGLALAERQGTVLKLDVGWFRRRAHLEDHCRYALSCFNITEQFAAYREISSIKGRNLPRLVRVCGALGGALRHHDRALWERRGKVHRQDGFGYCPDFQRLPDNTYLQGSWQSEAFFSPVADLLRLHFSPRYPHAPSVVALAGRIRSGPSAAVHFRRGDYVTNPGANRLNGPLALDYYARALERLYAAHPDVTLYIFSDDIDAVEREFRPRGPHVFVRATEPWHSFDEIWLMSLCEHAVISNSTFSWWAAWLNRHPGKLIIAPDLWLADRTWMSEDVVPPGWLRIPR